MNDVGSVCQNSGTTQLVISQVNNDFVVHSENLIAYVEKAAKLKRKFYYFELRKLNHNKNEMVDKLVKIVFGETPNDEGIEVEVLPRTSTVQPFQEAELEEKSWIDEITDYIIHDTLPHDRERARVVWRRAARYTVLNHILYRRSFSKPLLRCVLPDRTRQVLEEFHEGICGGHPGVRSLSYKIINQGY